MKNDLYKKVTTEVIGLLKMQLGSWNKPWVNKIEDLVPYNVATNKSYKGINAISLGCTARNKDFSSNAWLTFNQARKLGAKVKKGTKASSIYYYKFIYKDDNGKVLPKATTEKMKLEEKKILNNYEIFKYYPIFNTDQVIGLPDNLKKNYKYRNT